MLLRRTLLTICKSFIKSNFDYEDIIFGQALLTITGAIRDTSWEKHHQELGL